MHTLLTLPKESDTVNPLHTRDPLTLRPLNYYFLVEVGGNSVTKSGIEIADAFVAVHSYGTIIRTDADIRTQPQVPSGIKDLKAGDHIMFVPNNKYDVPTVGGAISKLIMVPVSAIIGVYDTD